VWATAPYLHDGSAPTLAGSGAGPRRGTPPPVNQAPTVSLTAPAGGSSATTGTPVTLAASAADADGSVARVEFYAGSTLLGSDTTAPYTFTWTPATAGSYALTARAFDNAGAATTSSALGFTVTAAPPPPASGTGLRASYFSNPTLAGTAVLTRTEVPWFNWGTGAPAPGIGADNFSVRWAGEIQALEAGTYQFRTLSDDGVRVWVNGVLRINNWTAHAPTVDTSAGITLAAGQRVSIVVEFQEFGGGAVLQLSWLRPGGAWAAVPAAQLYAAATLTPPAPPAGVPPATAVACAAEGGTCVLPGGATARVWYGAGSSWVTRSGVTGSIACTNAVFGDPIPGTVKACRYELT
jgi:hypothetical protein